MALRASYPPRGVFFELAFGAINYRIATLARRAASRCADALSSRATASRCPISIIGMVGVGGRGPGTALLFSLPFVLKFMAARRSTARVTATTWPWHRAPGHSANIPGPRARPGACARAARIPRQVDRRYTRYEFAVRPRQGTGSRRRPAPQLLS